MHYSQINYVRDFRSFFYFVRNLNENTTACVVAYADGFRRFTWIADGDSVPATQLLNYGRLTCSPEFFRRRKIRVQGHIAGAAGRYRKTANMPKTVDWGRSGITGGGGAPLQWLNESASTRGRTRGMNERRCFQTTHRGAISKTGWLAQSRAIMLLRRLGKQDRWVRS